MIHSMETSAEPIPHASSPRWWWWTRFVVVALLTTGAIFGMAQSTAFAMSWPYAKAIAVLADANEDSSRQFWSEVPSQRWERASPTFLADCGGFGSVIPWLWLTDWLWFIPIGFGASLIMSLMFPAWPPRTRRAFALLVLIGALAAWGIYAYVFVWGTTFPIALAQREIGWIFAVATAIVGVASLILWIPLARALLRAALRRIGNREGLRLWQGLWTADGLPLPSRFV